MASIHKFKVLAMTSIAIFSLFTTFVGVFAWFSAIRKVDINGDGFEVTSYDGFITGLKVYSSISTTNSSGNVTEYQSYIYDSTNPLATYEVVQGSNKLKRTDSGTSTPMLGQYSSLMNNKPNVLFLFSLDTTIGEQDHPSLAFKIKGKTTYNDSHFYIENKKPTKELKSNGNDLSAIVEFFGTGISSSDLTSLTVDGKYYMDGSKVTDINFSSSNFTRYHIPTISGSAASDFAVEYDNSLTLNPLTLKPDYPEYVAIVCEYYEDALEYLYAINLGNENLNQDTLGFSCDFDLEVM